MEMRIPIRALAVLAPALALLAGRGFFAQGASSAEWPTYGHDAGGMRFSPLRDITPANVATLEVAWTYHMKPAAAPAAAPDAAEPAPGRGRGRGGGSGFSSSSVTPIVAGGTMYLSTPYQRVVAVDPTTGQEVWAFQLPSGGPSTRGVEYWPGDGQTPAHHAFHQSRPGLELIV